MRAHVQRPDHRRGTRADEIELSTIRGPFPGATSVLDLQRQVGNRAVTALIGGARLQRMFLESGAAEAAFGSGFLDAHLDERLPEINSLIARLPDEPRAWMEGLKLEIKLSLLHQVGDRGDADIVVRICTALVQRPPVGYPDLSDGATCWRFLLEMARPDAIPKDLGMLGRLPEWVAKLKKIYEDADVRALERDLEGFHRATEAGRRHLADVRSFVGKPEVASGEGDPRAVMKFLTNELTAWLLTVYRGAASSLGLTDYVLMAVGSVGREEMFPRSDVDYTVLVNALTAKVSAVDAVIALQLKLMGEPELDPIGKGTAQDVATEHVVTKRDVLLDARTLHAEGAGGTQLEKTYYETRHRELGQEARRLEIATALIDTESTKFSPKSDYLRWDDKDVKKGLLRLPTFTTRNLGFYYGREIEQLNVWDRVADLVEQKILSKELGQRIIKVVNFASNLRIKLHNFYKSENDTFRLREDAESDADYKGYVLAPWEEKEYKECVAVNEDLYRRSQAFTLPRSMTLAKLREGATEESATDAMGTGVYRDTIVRSTTMKLADGRVAILREQILDTPERLVIGRRVELAGVDYTVQPDGVLKGEGGKRIYIPSQDNPFALP